MVASQFAHWLLLLLVLLLLLRVQSDWGYNLGSNNWRGASGYLSGRSIDPLMGTRCAAVQCSQRWSVRLHVEAPHVLRSLGFVCAL